MQKRQQETAINESISEENDDQFRKYFDRDFFRKLHVLVLV